METGRVEPLAKSIYLDYVATTPLADEVLTAIHDALRDAWGNPSSSHQAGLKAKQVIATARSQVAQMLNASPEDIVFMSGGTEANNMVVYSCIKHFNLTHTIAASEQLRPHIITSNIEHDSVRLLLEDLEQQKLIDVSYVPVSTQHGHVLVSDVMAAVRPTTCLVTLMMANNETGVIQPIAKVREQINLVNATRQFAANSTNDESSLPHIYLHTDAAQTIGKLDVDVEQLGVDYLTVVGHKFYGPRIGALYTRGITSQRIPLYPLFFGGGQERGLRPGTENTGMIAGLGKAAELVTKNLETYINHMSSMRDRLKQGLQDRFSNKVVFNASYDASQRIPNLLNFSFLDEKATGSYILAQAKQLQASVGSACHASKGTSVSAVLLASGVSEEAARNALRFSVGRETTSTDIDDVIDILASVVMPA